MIERINAIRAEAEAAVVAAATTAELEELRVRFLGRKAELPNLLRGVADLDPQERGQVGKAANQTRQALEGLIAARGANLEAAELRERLAGDRADVTLPGDPPAPVGHLHLLTATRREIDPRLEPWWLAASTVEEDTTPHWSDRVAGGLVEQRGLAVSRRVTTVQGEGRVIVVELLLDSYERHATSVNEMVKQLEKLGTPATVDGKWRPPLCTFVWGDKFPQFRGVIESLQVKYTMFRRNGEPVRATVTLKIKEANEIDGKAPKKNHRQAAEEQDCDDARDARVA